MACSCSGVFAPVAATAAFVKKIAWATLPVLGILGSSCMHCYTNVHVDYIRTRHSMGSWYSHALYEETQGYRGNAGPSHSHHHLHETCMFCNTHKAHSKPHLPEKIRPRLALNLLKHTRRKSSCCKSFLPTVKAWSLPVKQKRVRCFCTLPLRINPGQCGKNARQVLGHALGLQRDPSISITTTSSLQPLFPAAISSHRHSHL